MPYNERELIIECKSGKTEPFGQIYDRHIRTIYNFIFYKVFDKETAEDLTSQTFFKALKNIGSVDPERPILSWLYKIAHNSVLDHYRSARQPEDIDDYWDIGGDEDLVKDLDAETDVVRIKKYLKKLSQIERDIVFMRVWQELPYHMIAEILDKSEASCKMSYSRALKKLKTIIPQEKT